MSGGNPWRRENVLKKAQKFSFKGALHDSEARSIHHVVARTPTAITYSRKNRGGNL